MLLTFVAALASVGAFASPLLPRQSNPTLTYVDFHPCESEGTVHNITISSCGQGRGTFEKPCKFYQGYNYTITLSYTPQIGATAPRANLIAYTNDLDPNGAETQYPYSGQSFGGCSYTPCPIEADQTFTYTYELRTLASPFDALAFNMTSSLVGPSIMCARFPIEFVPSTA